MRVADYVARRLADWGVTHVFMVAGGGAMYLNDAFGCEPRIRCICNHHEQACSMAAEGYSRVAEAPSVISVTTGPGGINALNGVFGCWTDSIPQLVISGQVKREVCMATYSIPGLRQLGYQEADIISMVRSVTKYAVLIDDPQAIRYHLERAWYLTTAARPGPCWIDVPLDVQSARVDPERLCPYDPREDSPDWDPELLISQCRAVLARIRISKHPVLLAGAGIRRSSSADVFHTVAEKLGLPVVTSRTSQDLIATDHPLFCGRPAADNGDRPGAFTIQNADLLLSVGCRLTLMQTGYQYGAFARSAFKIVVDVDAAELAKPTVKADLAIHADAGMFLAELNRQIDEQGLDCARHSDWLAWCKERVRKYPVVLRRHRAHGARPNPYHLVDQLIRSLNSDDVVVCANGSAFVIASQVAFMGRGQRLFFNSGCASMGHGLPAAIGAAFARKGKRVICLEGDGSIQMNIQELQTIRHHSLPIKVFVLNNAGYLSIRTTQKNYFGRFIGEGPGSGVSFPDYARVAEAYGIPAARIEGCDFEKQIRAILADPGPVLCEVLVDPNQLFEPRASSRQLADGRLAALPLEELWPFLDEQELESNLLVPRYGSVPAEVDE